MDNPGADEGGGPVRGRGKGRGGGAGKGGGNYWKNKAKFQKFQSNRGGESNVPKTDSVTQLSALSQIQVCLVSICLTIQCIIFVMMYIVTYSFTGETKDWN